MWIGRRKCKVLREGILPYRESFKCKVFDGFVKSPFNVIPAKAGIRKRSKTQDFAMAGSVFFTSSSSLNSGGKDIWVRRIWGKVC
jgi:hypothetical protein